MSVQNQTVKNVYTGNGSTTVFPYTFDLLVADGEHVGVYVTNDAGVSEPTDNFTIDTTAKTVTYPKTGDALPSDKKIVIRREIPNEQELNLVNGGEFFADDIEGEMDREVMMIQQLQDAVDRSIKVDPASDVQPEDLLESIAQSVADAAESASNAATSEANAETWSEGNDTDVAALGGTHSSKGWSDVAKTWAEGTDEQMPPIHGVHSSKGWAAEAEKEKVDAHIWAEGTDAQVEALGGTHSAKVWAQSEEKVYYIDNVAAMRANAFCVPGMMVMTKGYYATNDGGAATYNIRAAAAGDVDDGGSIIILDNGNVAELITDGVVNVRQFGAKGDGVTDDTSKIQSAINYVRNNPQIYGSYIVYGQIKFPKGIYLITDSLDFTSMRYDLTVDLCDSSIDAQFTGNYPVFDFSDSRYYTVCNGRIYANESNNAPAVGLLQARRNSDKRVASDGTLIQLDIKGYFGVSALYNVSSELSTYKKCNFVNSNDGDGLAFYIGDTNAYSVASKYVTIMPQGTSISCVCHDIEDCCFYKTGTASVNGSAIEFIGASYLEMSGYNYVQCNSGIGGIVIRHAAKMTINVYHECTTAGPMSIIYFDGTGGSPNNSVASIDIEAHGTTNDSAIADVVFNEISTITTAKIQTNTLLVRSTSNITQIRNADIYVRGAIDLSGARLYDGTLYAASREDITFLGTNPQNFFGTVYADDGVVIPSFQRIPIINNKAFSYVRYAVINNNTDLETINIDHPVPGMEMLVRARSSSITATLKHGVGNIYLPNGQDVVLSDLSPVRLVYDEAYAKWVMVQ